MPDFSKSKDNEISYIEYTVKRYFPISKIRVTFTYSSWDIISGWGFMPSVFRREFPDDFPDPTDDTGHFTMNDELLIKLVRLHPVLYDLEHSKYKDRCKTAIWDEIGTKMGLNGNLCKVRWNNIRDNFRKSVQKNATKSSQGQKAVKPYKFYEQLTFLKKFISDGNTTQSNKDSMNDSNDEFNDEPVQLSAADTDMLYRPSRPTFNWDQSGAITTSATKRTVTVRRPRIPREIRIGQRPNTAKLLDKLFNKREDPVDRFLSSIAPTLKELDRNDWVEAKSEIFAILEKYEAKLATQNYASDTLDYRL